jgi:CheY-like chemotaxis protein
MVRVASNGGETFLRILDGVHVLIVDDVADNREIERLLLEWHGARVTEAESVSDALVRTEFDAPDVVVTDIHMPDTSGYSLLEKLREAASADGRRLPVVALTGDASDRARETMRIAGFDAVLFKPVDPDKLVRAVAGLMGRY